MCDRDCFNCKYDDCICDEFIHDDFNELYKAELAAGLIKETNTIAEKQREERNAKQRAYYAAHKEKYRQYKQKYYKKNAERLKAYQKEYYWKWKEGIQGQPFI